MIFKPFGNKTEEQIVLLRKLLQKSASVAQKKLIKLDLTKLENGYKSEKEHAYYLDFEFKDSKNIIVLHDIRLEHNGRTAQIDHILISRMEITVLESKSFTGDLTIKDDGALEVRYGKNKDTFPNPIEQNNRHKQVLESLINDQFDLQANTRFFGGLSFKSKILINPKTTIINKKLPENYERADSYITRRNKEVDNMSPLDVLKFASTLMSIEKAKKLAKFLMRHDKPLSFDYRKKYHIKPNADLFVQEKPISYGKETSEPSSVNKIIYACSECKSTNLEVNYGRNYYFKCLTCTSNIPIRHTCNTANCKPKTKKKKLQFFKVCEVCGIDEVFWENKKLS